MRFITFSHFLPQGNFSKNFRLRAFTTKSEKPIFIGVTMKSHKNAEKHAVIRSLALEILLQLLRTGRIPQPGPEWGTTIGMVKHTLEKRLFQEGECLFKVSRVCDQGLKEFDESNDGYFSTHQNEVFFNNTAA